MYQHDYTQHRLTTTSPIEMPKASGFLWNKKMMLHANCRGFVSAQYMQPEPRKYAYAPNLEAKTFMQPEQGYFSHHTGRFFYLKCLDSDELISIPFEPMRKPLDDYCFNIGKEDIQWRIQHWGLVITVKLTLPVNDTVELWQVTIENNNNHKKRIALYPYFTIGYMSWMNQSADVSQELNGIIASCVTPYQHVEDYFKNQLLKDKTFFLSKHSFQSWNANQASVEGEGGLHNPSDLQESMLSNRKALFETPVACLHFEHHMHPSTTIEHRFIFGPAQNNSEIEHLKKLYLDNDDAFQKAEQQFRQYLAPISDVLNIQSPDKSLNEFVNHWLPRQVFYHGDVNRLTTDPQTRNYLQDAMGMTYLSPAHCRIALTTAISQQSCSGAMPDGILLHPDAELKYINQVPHSDHCVWLTLCLESYLNTTNDQSLLQMVLPFKDCDNPVSIINHINLAFDYLLASRDERGLSYIEQGDWCDPMNMVGYKGKGVSAWLTMATSYSLGVWSKLCRQYQINSEKLAQFEHAIDELNIAINKYFWAGKWYARGITDDNNLFGIETDNEGKIFLNAQTWSMLSGAADEEKITSMLTSVQQHLETPYGVMMLAPAFTKMREDIGRVTQKFPGVAENGSIYNHAAAFYAFSLFEINQTDLGFKVLRNMIPTNNDVDIREQLPSFIPNYYRGAIYQHPEMAGKSSQLFNTGTIAWFYRSLIEQVCGLKGVAGTLQISPQLPSDWMTLKVNYRYLHATFSIKYQRSAKVNNIQVFHRNKLVDDNIFKDISPDMQYQLDVMLPIA